MLAGPCFFTYWCVLFELAATEPKEMDVSVVLGQQDSAVEVSKQQQRMRMPETTLSPPCCLHSLQAIALGAAPRPSCFPTAVFSASMRGHNVSAFNEEMLSD